MTYRHTLKGNLKKFGIDQSTWQKDCLDRKLWRNLIFNGANKFTTDWLEKKEKESIKRHSIINERILLGGGPPGVGGLPGVRVIDNARSERVVAI